MRSSGARGADLPRRRRLPWRREPAPFTVMAGTTIPATMQGGVNSNLPGEVIGRAA
jgi:type IV secretory pathway VirB10-like protein